MANNLQKGSAGPMRLYVGSLHFNITEDMLRGIFEPFGRVNFHLACCISLLEKPGLVVEHCQLLEIIQLHTHKTLVFLALLCPCIHRP